MLNFLQPGAWFGQPGRGSHIVVHVGVDGENVICGEAVLGTQLEKSLRGRVGKGAAGVGLEAVATEIPSLAETFDRPLGHGVGREQVEKSSMALDRLGGRGEPVAGEEGRENPVHGGLAGVQGLAHRPVDDLHAGRLGGAGPQRRECLLGRESQQPCRGDRRADVSHRAGHVPAGVVVPRSSGDRNAGLHLEAGDEGLDRESSGDRVDLTGRGDGRPQRSAAMNSGPVGVEGVVEIQHVGGDPVRQRRITGRGALRSAHDAAVRDPSPGSRARIPARTRPHSVAEPAMVQPSQSTRQRTAWCTTSAGRFSIRTPPRTWPGRRLSRNHRSLPAPVC